MTAEEYIRKTKPELVSEFENAIPDYFLTKDVLQMMTDFTVIHVQKALEKAANEAKMIKYYERSGEHYINNSMATEDGIIEIYKSSILNAYPIENIK